MSNQTNEILLLRAQDLVDELASDPAGRDDRILELINKNDLDTLREYLSKVEAQLSIEHFHNNNILEVGDEY